jgi:hypothetical protein
MQLAAFAALSKAEPRGDLESYALEEAILFRASGLVLPATFIGSTSEMSAQRTRGLATANGASSAIGLISSSLKECATMTAE